MPALILDSPLEDLFFFVTRQGDHYNFEFFINHTIIDSDCIDVLEEALFSLPGTDTCHSAVD